MVRVLAVDNDTIAFHSAGVNKKSRHGRFPSLSGVTDTNRSPHRVLSHISAQGQKVPLINIPKYYTIKTAFCQIFSGNFSANTRMFTIISCLRDTCRSFSLRFCVRSSRFPRYFRTQAQYQPFSCASLTMWNPFAVSASTTSAARSSMIPETMKHPSGFM